MPKLPVLKSCPFCGALPSVENLPEVYRRGVGPVTIVGCHNEGCPAEPSVLRRTKRGAIEGWNRRPEVEA